MRAAIATVKAKRNYVWQVVGTDAASRPEQAACQTAEAARDVRKQKEVIITGDARALLLGENALGRTPNVRCSWTRGGV